MKFRAYITPRFQPLRIFTRTSFTIDEYICTMCSKPCLDEIYNTIQCCNCEKWVHDICTNLSKSNLKQWSVDYLQFLCQRCTFDGSEYKARAALDRYVVKFIYLFIFCFTSQSTTFVMSGRCLNSNSTFIYLFIYLFIYSPTLHMPCAYRFY